MQRTSSGTHEGLTLAERFWMKVEVRGQDECWPWLAKCTANGRGRMRVDNQTIKLATHVLWFLTHGEWPKELVLHSCDVGWCLNPKHHYQGDYFDNARDRKRAGGYVVSDSTRAKISEAGKGRKWSLWRRFPITMAWLHEGETI